MMKKGVFSFFSLMLLALSVSAQGIRFDSTSGWKEIREDAKAQNKYIFVDLYATWCGPCKMMDAQVYPASEAGDAYNNKFISVRIQTDKTNADNESIKSRYQDADQMAAEYHIQAYPTLLFFSPEGKLVYRREGATNLKGFVELAQKAIASGKDNLPFIERYLKGQAAITEYPEIEEKARTSGNEALANEIALKYIHNYLDKLSDEELLTPDNYKYLSFYKHDHLLTKSDKIFKLSLRRPELIEQSAKADNGRSLATIIIYRDLYNSLIKDGKAVVAKPDWKAITKRIKKDYGDYYVDLKLLYTKKQYYFDLKEWNGFADVVDEFIRLNPPNAKDTGYGLGELNNDAWFGPFLNSDDPRIIKRASGWMELVVSLLDKSNPNNDYIDTYANLLYKSGNVQKAIEEEQGIIDRIVKQTGKPAEESAKGFVNTVNKMKAGEPTWK